NAVDARLAGQNGRMPWDLSLSHRRLRAARARQAPAKLPQRALVQGRWIGACRPVVDTEPEPELLRLAGRQLDVADEAEQRMCVIRGMRLDRRRTERLEHERPRRTEDHREPDAVRVVARGS